MFRPTALVLIELFKISDAETFLFVIAVRLSSSFTVLIPIAVVNAIILADIADYGIIL